MIHWPQVWISTKCQSHEWTISEETSGFPTLTLKAVQLGPELGAGPRPQWRPRAMYSWSGAWSAYEVFICMNIYLWKFKEGEYVKLNTTLHAHYQYPHLRDNTSNRSLCSPPHSTPKYIYYIYMHTHGIYYTYIYKLCIYKVFKYIYLPTSAFKIQIYTLYAYTHIPMDTCSI